MEILEEAALKHRKDIDGLRAVAVVPVVIFHLGIPHIATGGFVGVDVFFVISGYLITKIIYERIAAGTYSVADFYTKRARRILPALIPVYLTCLVLGSALLFPSELRGVRDATVSSAAFVSNIFFYAKSGYFSDIAKSSPLLHTWSLSVEEQFYIFLPALVYLISGFSRTRAFLALLVIAALSLIAAQYYIGFDRDAAFYLLPFRAWELLIGSLLALGVVPTAAKPALVEAEAGLGLLLVVIPMALLNSSSPFPGFLALPACLGTALVIHAGSSGRLTAVGRVLSVRPIQMIGLISYSVYLWHWPLIVFFPLLKGAPSNPEKLALLLASLVIGYLSWRFVEQPFRASKDTSSSRRSVLTTGAIGLLAVAILACLSVPLASIGAKSDPRIDALLAQRSPPDAEWRVNRCFLTSTSEGVNGYDRSLCLARRPGRPSILLLGDSHAAQYYPGLIAAFPEADVLQANASGCRPVGSFSGEPRCTDLLSYIVSEYLPAHHVDEIIVSARWQSGDVDRIAATIRKLAPYAGKVVVIGPIVEYSQPLPRVLALSLPKLDDRHIARYRIADTKGLDARFARAVRAAGARYVSSYGLICPDVCVTRVGDRSMQFDYGHLSVAGSRYVVAKAHSELSPI